MEGVAGGKAERLSDRISCRMVASHLRTRGSTTVKTDLQTAAETERERAPGTPVGKPAAPCVFSLIRPFLYRIKKITKIASL